MTTLSTTNKVSSNWMQLYTMGLWEKIGTFFTRKTSVKKVNMRNPAISYVYDNDTVGITLDETTSEELNERVASYVSTGIPIAFEFPYFKIQNGVIKFGDLASSNSDRNNNWNIDYFNETNGIVNMKITTSVTDSFLSTGKDTTILGSIAFHRNGVNGSWMITGSLSYKVDKRFTGMYTSLNWQTVPTNTNYLSVTPDKCVGVTSGSWTYQAGVFTINEPGTYRVKMTYDIKAPSGSSAAYRSFGISLHCQSAGVSAPVGANSASATMFGNDSIIFSGIYETPFMIRSSDLSNGRNTFAIVAGESTADNSILVRFKSLELEKVSDYIA